MVRHEVLEETEKLVGGKGKAHKYYVVSKEELLGHGRQYARVVLDPGSSVGWHQHVNDVEPYYILSGEGDFIEGNSQDGEKIRTHVKSGDVCIIDVGQWHSLENNSDKPLEFMALIYNKAGYLS